MCNKPQLKEENVKNLAIWVFGRYTITEIAKTKQLNQPMVSKKVWRIKKLGKGCGLNVFAAYKVKGKFSISVLSEKVKAENLCLYENLDN